jgi:hypothetical protein
MDQFDVKNAFVNARLDPKEPPIYIRQPPGYEIGHNKVLLVLRALYGLRHSPRAWYNMVHKMMISLGYTRSTFDQCVYYKKGKSAFPIITSIYVDDTLAIYHPDDQKIWYADKEKIQQLVKIDDLGEASWILSMKIQNDLKNGTIKLTQYAYIDKLLAKFNVSNKSIQNICTTDEIHSSEKDDGSSLLCDDDQHQLFRQIIGSINYLASATRPDLCYVTGRLSQYLVAPTLHHLKCAQNVLQYILHTRELGLTYKSCENVRTVQDLKLDVYVDASFATVLPDSRSVTGIVFQLNGNTIDAVSHRQTVVSKSTCMSEYTAMSEAVGESKWFKGFLKEVLQYQGIPVVHCDAQSAIATAQGEDLNRRNRHDAVRISWLREQYRNHEFTLNWVSTQEQIADVLTKRLNNKEFQSMRNQLMNC